MHRHPRAQQGLVSAAHVAFSCRQCEGPPHNYVRMPFGLVGAAEAFQHYMRDTQTACEARHQVVLAEMEEHPQEPSGPSEPPEARHRSGS